MRLRRHTQNNLPLHLMELEGPQRLHELAGARVDREEQRQSVVCLQFDQKMHCTAPATEEQSKNVSEWLPAIYCAPLSNRLPRSSSSLSSKLGMLGVSASGRLRSRSSSHATSRYAS